MENTRNIQKENLFILTILGVIALIFFALTSLPAVIISIFFAMIFINIKINKLLFTLIGLVLGALINFKLSFVNYFFNGAVNIIKILANALVHKNNVVEVYKAYVFNVNVVWQLVFAIIIGSILAQIYNSIVHKEELTVDAIKEKRITKIVNSLKLLEHDPRTTILGVDYDNLERTDINDNAKHIIVAGTTGSGKTVTISNFIESAMQKAYPVLAVDGKGDLDKGSLLHYMQDLSKKYNRKLYVINFVNPECSDYYNPFWGAGMTEAKDMLISMSDWTEPHYKINTERYLQQLIRILNLKKIPLSLNKIIEYSPIKFKQLIEEMKDEETLSIEEYTKLNNIIQATAEIVDAAMARFATTAESEAGEIFTGHGIDIYNAMKEHANILIILDSLGKPELSKQVGRLAILDAKKAVSKLFGDAIRKFFIFDEFNVYASDVAVDLLNKSRSANVTCIPAFQSLSDLDKAGGEALRNQVIENCNNYIIMRQNSPDSSQEWEKVIGEEEQMQYTQSIERKTGLFSSGNKETGTGSMHKVWESKHKSTEIQNLKTGQCIFISKDQSIEKKLKVRSIHLDLKKPLLVNNNIDNSDNVDNSNHEKEIKFHESIDGPVLTMNNDVQADKASNLSKDEFKDIEQILNDEN